METQRQSIPWVADAETISAGRRLTKAGFPRRWQWRARDLSPPYGGWPPPGRYRFRLPTAIVRCWEVTNPVWVPPIDKGSPERYAYAKFDEDQPLHIIDAEDPAWLHEPFVCHVASVPRTKAKTRRPATIQSDLDDLLAALGEPGPFETPSDYAEALVRHSAETFSATVTYHWRSWPGVNIRVRDEEKQLVEISRVTGDGRSYSMHRDVRRRKDGSWPREIVKPFDVGDRTYQQVLEPDVRLTGFGPGRRPVLRTFVDALSRWSCGRATCTNRRAASPST